MTSMHKFEITEWFDRHVTIQMGYLRVQVSRESIVEKKVGAQMVRTLDPNARITHVSAPRESPPKPDNTIYVEASTFAQAQQKLSEGNEAGRLSSARTDKLWKTRM